MNDNMNYSSEINNLKERMRELYNTFKEIFNLYCEIKNISFTDEFCINVFSSPEYRSFIITDGVLELFDIIDKDYLELLCKKYIKLDKEVTKQQNLIQEKMDNYELSMNNIIDGSANTFDISCYFSCLHESYQNYLNGCFEEEFTFKSEEMRRSAFHSVNQEKEINIMLSIPHDKVLHLMELPSPMKPNDFFSDLYNTYCNYYGDYKMDGLDSNTISKIYMKFLTDRAECLVNDILFGDNNNSKYKNVIDDILKKYDKKKIFMYIKKSFEKCINFRKFYEFKFIPEIILDYQYDGNHLYSIPTEDEYRYYRSTDAFTYLQDNLSYNLNDVIDIKYNSDERKYEYKEKNKLSDLQKDIIDTIFETFKGTLNISNIKTIRIENENSKSVKFGCIKIRVDGKQYKYYIKTKKIASDLPIDLLLLSYDESKLRKETIISVSCLYQSIILISYYLSKKLYQKGFKYTDEVECDDALKKYKDMIMMLLDKENINSNYEKVTEEIKKLFDITRDHLINVNLIVKYVNYFLKQDVDLGIIFKQYFKIDLETFCRENINEDELLGLDVIINSFFRKDLAAKTFRKQFGIVAFTNEGQKDEQPEFTMIMKLAQKLEDLLCLNGSKRQYDRTISMVGFSTDKTESPDGDEPIVNEYYAKTFMGKTVLQLICDMRVKGRNYKLDAIYNGDIQNPIFYNVITLDKYNPLYKDLIKEIFEHKKYKK